MSYWHSQKRPDEKKSHSYVKPPSAVRNRTPRPRPGNISRFSADQNSRAKPKLERRENVERSANLAELLRVRAGRKHCYLWLKQQLLIRRSQIRALVGEPDKLRPGEFSSFPSLCSSKNAAQLGRYLGHSLTGSPPELAGVD